MFLFYLSHSDEEIHSKQNSFSKVMKTLGVEDYDQKSDEQKDDQKSNEQNDDQKSNEENDTVIENININSMMLFFFVFIFLILF
jgi:hypothetical protein